MPLRSLKLLMFQHCSSGNLPYEVPHWALHAEIYTASHGLPATARLLLLLAVATSIYETKIIIMSLYVVPQ